jgi:hypothetical protein
MMGAILDGRPFVDAVKNGLRIRSSRAVARSPDATRENPFSTASVTSRHADVLLGTRKVTL